LLLLVSCELRMSLLQSVVS